MIENQFTFHNLETNAELQEDLELMRTVFGQDSGVDALIKRLLKHHPRMNLNNIMVLKHQGKMVASLTLIPLTWSIGGIHLNVAEMGCTATLAEYRKRGLMRKLINEFHRQVEAQGYDLVAIEGIPYFYRQFGYEYAIPLLEETRIALDQIPEHELKSKIRLFTRQDIPKAMQLLAHLQRKFYVHGVRDEAVWKVQEETRMASENAFQSYAVEEDGEVNAYFRISKDLSEKELVLREITDVNESTLKQILAFLKTQGLKKNLETLVAQTSYDDPSTNYLASLGAKKNVPPYAWQIRIVDHVRVFNKLKPLFNERIAASGHSMLAEKVNFNFRRFIIQMTIEKGVIEHVERLNFPEASPIGLNPLVFTQLILGYRSRHELEMNYPDFRVDPTFRAFIDVLFPKMPSYIHSIY